MDKCLNGFPKSSSTAKEKRKKIYIQNLVNALRIDQYVRPIKTTDTAPYQLLEHAYKEIAWSQSSDDERIDEAWVMFDRDYHARYEETVELAGKLNPQVNVCWTNPCIEFWFWLHYSQPGQKPKFTDSVAISSETKREELDDETFVTTTVTHFRKIIRPDSMLKQLRKFVASYSKVRCPEGMVERTPRAVENLNLIAQSEDPTKIGSAMPRMLKRFVEISELVHSNSEIYPSEVKPTLAPTPTPTPLPALTDKVLAGRKMLVDFIEFPAADTPSKCLLQQLRESAARLQSLLPMNKEIATATTHCINQIDKLLKVLKTKTDKEIQQQLGKTQAYAKALLDRFDWYASITLPQRESKRPEGMTQKSDDATEMPIAERSIVVETYRDEESLDTKNSVLSEDDLRILKEFKKQKAVYEEAIAAVIQSDRTEEITSNLQAATEALEKVCKMWENLTALSQLPTDA